MTNPDFRSLLLDRVAQARTLQDLGRYVRYGVAGIEEIRCKICSTTIRKLVPHDQFTEQRTINGKTFTAERLILATLPNYCEVMLTFNDGSKHATNLCHPCAQSLSLDKADWVYCCDMNEWLLDSTQASEAFWERQYKRQVISFEVFPPGQPAV